MDTNPSVIAQELIENLSHTRVFLSMPHIPGITPVCMDAPHVRSFYDESCGMQRRDGYFAVNEAALSTLDHGNLYGDAVFEGIRIDDRRILLLKEHVDRWMASAQKIDLAFPYSREALCEIILELSRQSLRTGTCGYLRPVLTRGIGTLAVSYAQSVAPTLYIVCSSVSLYPKSHYERGIDVTVARKIRRNDARFIDPNIKSNNYLNNVLALLETRHTGALETIMLTSDGYVAEATADNIFVAETIDGRPVLKCPAARYALVGLTRTLVLNCARSLGFTVIEDPHMLVSDFIGPKREVFITGTACGLMPVTRIDGLETAPPDKRRLTNCLREAVLAHGREEGVSFGLDEPKEALAAYLNRPNLLV